MIITIEILDELSRKAKQSPRLRMNKDLRNSSDDKRQRMLTALEPGTIVPIHRHPTTSETVCCVRGCLKEIIFEKDVDGNIIQVDEIILKAGSPLAVAQIPMGVWHTVECLESGTIIVESKDGHYEPTSPEDVIID